MASESLRHMIAHSAASGLAKLKSNKAYMNYVILKHP